MLTGAGVLVAYDPAIKSFRSIDRAPSRDFKAVAYSPSLFRLEDPMMANLAYGLDVKLRIGLVQSPISMKCNSMKEPREELRKKCEEQKELVERFQQNKSRIEQLKEQINLKDDYGIDVFLI